MDVTIRLPEDISESLEGRWENVPRHALETIAVEGYRTGALTESQVRRLLGYETRFDVHALLKEHKVPLNYTEADLEEDLAAHRELGILPADDRRRRQRPCVDENLIRSIFGQRIH